MLNRIVRIWNSISDAFLTVIAVVSYICMIASLILICIAIFTGFNMSNIYKYAIILVSTTYVNIKVNGG